MKAILTFSLGLTFAATSMATEACKYVLNPLKDNEREWMIQDAKRERIVSDFFESIQRFQTGRQIMTDMTAEMLTSDIVVAFKNLKNMKTPEIEVRKGISADFLSIHGGEIRLENYMKEKVQVTLVRRGNVALLVLDTGERMMKEQFTVHLYEQSAEHGKEMWISRGGIEVGGIPEFMRRANRSGDSGKSADFLRSYFSFFASSPRAATESLEMMSLVVGRDFTALKELAVSRVIKSELIAAHRITTFKFRKMLMDLIQATIVKRGSFSATLGDDNQDFAIRTGAQLQKNKEFKRYPFVKNLNPNHEYFVTEDTGAKRFTAVDLTLGRATGEVKAYRQADDELSTQVMHLDGMDRPVGEIEYYDSIMDHVKYLHTRLFEKGT